MKEIIAKLEQLAATEHAAFQLSARQYQPLRGTHWIAEILTAERDEPVLLHAEGSSAEQAIAALDLKCRS